MKRNLNVEIVIYGTEQLCPSCVQLPSSKDTYEWLYAAISRRFPDNTIKIAYVDIYSPPKEEVLRKFSQRVIDEEMFYPVVVINGKIVGEGNPSLKVIFKELENFGFA